MFLDRFRKPRPSRAVLALYDDPDRLLNAAAVAREHGFRDMDAFTPYAVHGLSEVLGIKKSWIPYVTLVMGLTGAALGLTFEIWTSAVDWPLIVGGKPYVSLPAFIPITFESGVLIVGTTTRKVILPRVRVSGIGHMVRGLFLKGNIFKASLAVACFARE